MAQTVSGATNDNGTTGTVAADEVVTKIELDTRSLLERLDLIGTPADQAAAAKAGAFFFGPANSVAIIESQATALSKWWSAGLGSGVVAAWGAVRVFWNTNPPVHGVLLWGASIVSAALLLAIAIIVASDVLSRGRGAAATVQARARSSPGSDSSDCRRTHRSPCRSGGGDQSGRSDHHSQEGAEHRSGRSGRGGMDGAPRSIPQRPDRNTRQVLRGKGLEAGVGGRQFDPVQLGPTSCRPTGGIDVLVTDLSP